MKASFKVALSVTFPLISLSTTLLPQQNISSKGYRSTIVLTSEEHVMRAPQPKIVLWGGIFPLYDLVDFEGNMAGIWSPNVVKSLLALTGVVVVITLLFVMWNRLLLRRIRARTAQIVESEELYRTLFEQSQNAIVIIDSKTNKFKYANHAAVKMLGYSRTELLSLDIGEIHSAEALDKVQSEFEAQLKGLKATTYGQPFLRKDGSVIYADISTRRMSTSKGSFVFWIATDVTQRKKAEQALQKSERFVQSILMSIHDHIAVLDKHGVILTVNKSWIDFARQNNVSSIDLVSPGQNYLDICRRAVKDSDDDIARTALEGIFSVLKGHHNRFDMEYPCHSNSEQRWFLMSVMPLIGSEEGVFIAHTEITERKQAELQVREMASFAELNPAPVLRVNSDGVIMSCNPASVEILGKNAKKGTSIASVLPDLSKIDLHRCIQDDILLSQEVNIKGRFYLFILRGVSNVQLVYIYGSDITDRKKAEKDLHQLRDELIHATRLGTMAEFTAALAHEINHPLGSILNNANAAKRFLEHENPDLDEIREIIADIISEDRRARDVILKLRDLMKKADSQRTPLNINDIIEEVLCLTKSELVIENISLSKQLEKHLPKVKGDRVQLQQVLLNLIINAADAMKKSKVKNLCVCTQKKDAQSIVISVIDSGVGFDENKKDNLFKPFYTTKKQGLGMGLSVDKTIIKAHEGQIWAEKNKEGGASFFVTLPINKEKWS